MVEADLQIREGPLSMLLVRVVRSPCSPELLGVLLATP